MPEAGSYTASGHRIAGRLLSEYQMFRFDPRYTVARWRDEHFIASKRVQLNPLKLQAFSLATMISRVA